MMNRQSNGRVIHILLIEDNPGDIRLTQEVLKSSKIQKHLHIARDGEDALAFLHQKTPYAGVPRPDLIILDLSLPRKNGHQVLAEVKAEPGLKLIPIIVLANSAADEDILQSYNLYANCYITKPLKFDEFVKVIQSIETFWVSTAKLPPSEGK